jgi:HlyD family secretion protein
MKGKKKKWFFYIASALVLFGLVFLALKPTPLEVDLKPAQRGTLLVTVDEEGETRVRDRYVVSAPVPGRLKRIGLREGDAVAQGRTVAVIYPLPLGKRETAETRARQKEAEARQREAEVLVGQVRLNLEKAVRERLRMEELQKNGLATRQELDFARDAERIRAQEVEAAKLKAQAAAFEVQVIQAGLLALEGEGEAKTIQVRSPVSGRVLKVLEKNEQVVSSGTPLVTLGDPARLEVVIDLLTTEAVKVRPGNTVLLERWGGDKPLQARVRLVEPFGFTKVSALGVEEKRVNVIADFMDRPQLLADGFRVEARIIVWKGDEVLKIPSSALFRLGREWAVFVLKEGRARTRKVEVGHQGTFESEILKGLKEGEEVIIHPPSQIRDGTRIKKREIPGILR